MDIDATNLRMLLPLVALLPGAATGATEEPAFTLVAETDMYEIRRYEPYIVASTVVSGDFRSAGNDAFRRLAAYIFGDNSRSEEMQMTAPVESRVADPGMRMNMTAPVTSAARADDSYVYSFVMERRFSMDTLPAPRDPRIEIMAVPARTMAVRRYSGTWSERNYEKHEALLLTSLADDGVRIVGEPLLARYNGPLTPWFMRRNEVMIEVAARDSNTE